MAEPRRTFAPVVLLGLAAAGLSAFAGHRPWAEVTGASGEAEGLSRAVASTGGGVGESPAAGALALVALAAWGVLLVTRGRLRRAAAVLAGVAAAAVLVVVVLGFSTVPDDLRQAVGDVGVAGPEVRRTGWYWASLVAAPLSLAAAVLAVRWVPAWPEMGSRYDAPAAAAGPTPPAADPASRDPLELWKELDQGRDPTQ